MGRIDIKGSEDKTLERRHIDLMLRYKDEYELVKKKEHKTFKNVAEFYKERQICKQNFLKYYRRYQNSGGNIANPLQNGLAILKKALLKPFFR